MKGPPLVRNAAEEALRAQWQAAYDQPFVGWDFSVFGERRVTLHRAPVWDYTERVLTAIDNAQRMLDMDTGGGEKLAGLPRRPPWTVATEGYAPNVALVHQRLAPLGVRVVAVRDAKRLPFRTGQFDLVTNRHGRYAAADPHPGCPPGPLPWGEGWPSAARPG